MKNKDFDIEKLFKDFLEKIGKSNWEMEKEFLLQKLKEVKSENDLEHFFLKTIQWYCHKQDKALHKKMEGKDNE